MANLQATTVSAIAAILPILLRMQCQHTLETFQKLPWGEKSRTRPEKYPDREAAEDLTPDGTSRPPRSSSCCCLSRRKEETTALATTPNEPTARRSGPVAPGAVEAMMSENSPSTTIELAPNRAFLEDEPVE